MLSDRLITEISKLVDESLYKELKAYPKPGLVSYIDSGSHRDMDHTTFEKSINSLSDYFYAIAKAANEGYGFSVFKNIGIEAEEKMLKETGGINTHRGAIFNLGLLLASAVYELRENKKINIFSVCKNVGDRWGKDILENNVNQLSNGYYVKSKYSIGGAREEASGGYRTITKHLIPEYKKAKYLGVSENRKHTQCLMVSISNLTDTNVIYRGGMINYTLALNITKKFIYDGGCYQNDWYKKLLLIHSHFKRKNISPGGSADLLAALIFIMSLENI